MNVERAVNLWRSINLDLESPPSIKNLLARDAIENISQPQKICVEHQTSYNLFAERVNELALNLF